MEWYCMTDSHPNIISIQMHCQPPTLGHLLGLDIIAHNFINGPQDRIIVTIPEKPSDPPFIEPELAGELLRLSFEDSGLRDPIDLSKHIEIYIGSSKELFLRGAPEQPGLVSVGRLQSIDETFEAELHQKKEGARTGPAITRFIGGFRSSADYEGRANELRVLVEAAKEFGLSVPSYGLLLQERLDWKLRDGLAAIASKDAVFIHRYPVTERVTKLATAGNSTIMSRAVRELLQFPGAAESTLRGGLSPNISPKVADILINAYLAVKKGRRVSELGFDAVKVFNDSIRGQLPNAGNNVIKLSRAPEIARNI
jgi:hypothetical protein